MEVTNAARNCKHLKAQAYLLKDYISQTHLF